MECRNCNRNLDSPLEWEVNSLTCAECQRHLGYCDFLDDLSNQMEKSNEIRVRVSISEFCSSSVGSNLGQPGILCVSQSGFSFEEVPAIFNELLDFFNWSPEIKIGPHEYNPLSENRKFLASQDLSDAVGLRELPNDQAMFAPWYESDMRTAFAITIPFNGIAKTFWLDASMVGQPDRARDEKLGEVHYFGGLHDFELKEIFDCFLDQVTDFAILSPEERQEFGGSAAFNLSSKSNALRTMDPLSLRYAAGRGLGQTPWLQGHYF